VSKKRQRLSTKTEREKKEVAEEIDHVGSIVLLARLAFFSGIVMMIIMEPACPFKKREICNEIIR
jgi:hypothetical protein